MSFKWFKKKGETARTPLAPKGKGGPAKDDDTPAKDSRQSANGSATAPAAAPDPVQVVSKPNEGPATAEAEGAPGAPGTGLFARLKRGLAKTREILTTDIDKLFSGKGQLDDQMLEEIEELLITSDIGVQTAMGLMATITETARNITSPDALKRLLKQEIRALLTTVAAPRKIDPRPKPWVVMVVGVNGVGKTTTIGKIAAREAGQGRKVLIAAADTFRAAAVEQLAIWAERSGADFVRHQDNADPAAVAFDSIEAALARDIDTVFIDTAGRLHTKVNLMEELKKIQRTIAKKMPHAPHEILLVLDATTGQNALAQAKLFNSSLGVTALALTKLDGTAKGGIVISICRQLQLPLHYVGVGEAIEDLQPFDVEQFVDALF